MIGRLPHPDDASRYVYVPLVYNAATGDWRPPHDGYHNSEREAAIACAEAIARRAEELQINLSRLLGAPELADLILLTGGLYTLDRARGSLRPLAELDPPADPPSQEAVFVEQLLGALDKAAELKRGEMMLDGIRRVIAFLSTWTASLERALQSMQGLGEPEDSESGPAEGRSASARAAMSP